MDAERIGFYSAGGVKQNEYGGRQVSCADAYLTEGSEVETIKKWIETNLLEQE